MNEAGISRIERLDLRAELLRSGSLVIVDLRVSLSGSVRPFARLAAAPVQAFSQWLTRYDRMNRVRPLRPSWVAFLDYAVREREG